MEDKFVAKKPDVYLVTEKAGWTQPDGSVRFSKESRTHLRKVKVNEIQ